MSKMEIQFDYFRLYSRELDRDNNKAKDRIYDLKGGLINIIKACKSDEARIQLLSPDSKMAIGKYKF